MSYSLYLFRAEVREQYPTADELGDALESHDELFLRFTPAEKEELQQRLAAYNYSVVSAHDDRTEYQFNDGSDGVSATLHAYFLHFDAASTDDAVAEILLTSSEFCDSGLFAVFNFQAGTWNDDF